MGFKHRNVLVIQGANTGIWLCEYIYLGVVV